MEYREANAADVPAMALCRDGDTVVGAADERMAAYFDGRHHPQYALAARTGYVALCDKRIIAYIAGHESTRLGCAGEVQYLYVSPEHRRHGVASELLRQLAGWFRERGALRVCVDVNPESAPASPFYLNMGARPLSRHWYIWDDITTILDDETR
jgi:GNAT superfamily N-acetyltransferase